MLTANSFVAKSALEGEHLGESLDVIHLAAMRACGLAGFRFQDKRRDLFLGEDGATFVADEV